MSDINSIAISGRIGQDPELKDINGTSKLEIRLASSQKWRSKQGEDREKTTWVTVGFWGPRAEGLQRYLSKGQQVFVTGELEVRTYEKKDGTNGIAVEIRGDKLSFGKDGKGGARGASREDFSGGGQGAQSFPDDDFADDQIPF